MELDIQNTSIYTFVAKFILGIFCIFLTFLWWFQMYNIEYSAYSANWFISMEWN